MLYSHESAAALELASSTGVWVTDASNSKDRSGIAAQTRTPAISESNSEQRSHGNFRPDIEGLRAVALLAVVLFHAAVPGFGGGFVGVDVFFVISGFLISGLLWREASAKGGISLRRFWGARARRLLPASAMVGLVTMLACALLLPAMQIKTTTIDGIASALYVSNLWFMAQGVNYFGNHNVLLPTPFQHYWSLGVEEQFYLLWPLVIIATAWVIRRARGHSTRTESTSSVRPFLIVLVVIAVGSFMLSWVVTYVMPPAAYFSLPTRAWQLAVGGLVALSVGYWRRLDPRLAAFTGWAGLALIVLACGRLSSTTVYPGLAALLPTLGAALVIVAGCAQPSKGCGRLLGWAPMMAIGRVSYSWYLWHWPVLVLVPVAFGHPFGLTGRLALVLLSGALAVVTLRYLENPLRFSPRFRQSPRASLVLGGAATSIVVCVGLILLQGVPTPVGRGPVAKRLVISATPPPPGSSVAAYDAALQDVFAQVQAGVAASADMQEVPANLSPPLTSQTAQMAAIRAGGCLLLPLQSDQSECVAGDAESQTTLALVGDSRAAMMRPAFQKAAEDRGWRLEMMAKAACPIVDLPLTSHFNQFAEDFQRCSQWRSDIINRLIAERPNLVVISTSRGYSSEGTGIWGLPGFVMYDAAWIRTLGDFVGKLSSNGSRVLLLGPSPDPNGAVPDCLGAHLADVTACEALRDSLKPAGIAAELAATQANGGQYADITPLFCAPTPGRCPVIVGNTMVYFDAGHITSEYSQLLAPAMGALSDRALATNQRA